MGKTKVSVITPSYNQGEFIEDTIKSVISQEGGFHLEYIIMDGGSKDSTVEVIKKYEALLKEKKWPVKCKSIELKWVSEKDKGQTDAVNKGFRMATGEILGWVNSDDVYLPGCVEGAVKYFEHNPDVMMVYGEGYYVDREGEVIDRFPTLPDYKKLADYCIICQPSAFIRKESLDKVGLLDESLDFCMDYDYWVRVAKAFRIGYVPEYFACSRVYPETKTMSKTVDAYVEALNMLKRHYGSVSTQMIEAYIHYYLIRYLDRDKRFQNRVYEKLKRWLIKYKSYRLNGRA